MATGISPVSTPPSFRRRVFLAATVSAIVFMIIFLAGPYFLPMRLKWPDRRPIGMLFLASDYHSSDLNPRGWFNNPQLDVSGTNGPAKFAEALRAYTVRSLPYLKRANAQGVIIWDLEGEEFPHKTTYIGDPRLLNRLAPEMEAVADAFVNELRAAGLRIGLTIRPQHLKFSAGIPRQTHQFNLAAELRAKINYARKRWGATIFYIDSTYGLLRPDEVWQLRALALEFPDCLLIPEHTTPAYQSFSAPFAVLHNPASLSTPGWVRKVFPNSFRVVKIADSVNAPATIPSIWTRGDILLFPAWYDNEEIKSLEKLAEMNKPPAT